MGEERRERGWEREGGDGGREDGRGEEGGIEEREG